MDPQISPGQKTRVIGLTWKCSEATSVWLSFYGTIKSPGVEAWRCLCLVPSLNKGEGSESTPNFIP